MSVQSRFAERLQREWQQPNGWQWWLLPLSWLFRLIVNLRHTAYEWRIFSQTRLPVPVVVIGNISVGGTGKTPLTIWLAQQLTKRQVRVGIILRGYGGSQTAPQAVSPDSDPRQAGDEAVLLAQNTHVPVWCARQRVAAGHAMLTAHPDLQLIVCDDGLQHLALSRDWEIAVIDTARGLGNQRLLPAGPLREPAKRLSTVQGIVLNGDAPVSLPVSIQHLWRMQLQPGLLHNLAAPSRQLDISQFQGQTVHAVAGIGHPERFFRQLEQAGLHIIRHAFPDHHPFCAQDLDFAGNIIMTSKDAVKCTDFATDQMWAWPVAAMLDEHLVDILLTELGVRHG